MYNSGYSHAKMGLPTKKLQRSKERSCGYYMRIVLLFSSLIQSLIIVSLVLFLVYGEPLQTVEEQRIKDLEQSYSRLSLENVALKAKEKNLTQQLNITLTAKKLGDKDLVTFRKLANASSLSITGLRTRWSQCEMEKRSMGNPMGNVRTPCISSGNDKFYELRLKQAEELLRLFRANFTEEIRVLKIELGNTQKDSIRYQLEGIELRRDKTFLEERIEMYEKKCKEDFINSLQGIPNVTKEFLKRVDDLFSKHISFQLSCEKQSIQLESIRANCSSLSTEVENKLQTYLDKVGSQVTSTIGANVKCMTENKRLTEDSSWCYRNRSEIIEVNRKVLKQTQQNYDKEVEKLLLDVTKLNGNKNLMNNLLSVKEIEIKMCEDKLKDLNTSLSICKLGQFPGGASNPFLQSFGQNKFGQGIFGGGSTGSMGSPFGTGLGSSAPGSTGYGRTPGSSIGSSVSGLGNTGLGLQKPGPVIPPSFGTSGTGFGSTGLGQPNVGWPNVGSMGTGLGGTGLSSPGFGSAGSSGTALTRTGLGATGTGAVGPNGAGLSALGTGRTSGSDPMAAYITQHLRELHQYTKSD